MDDAPRGDASSLSAVRLVTLISQAGPNYWIIFIPGAQFGLFSSSYSCVFRPRPSQIQILFNCLGYISSCKNIIWEFNDTKNWQNNAEELDHNGGTVTIF